MSSNRTSSGDTPVLIQLQNTAFWKAKLWCGILVGLQVFLFFGGLVSIFSEPWSLEYPWLAFPLAVAGALITARASYLKGRAEFLKRQHEYLDGLDSQPSARTLVNLRAELPLELRPEVERLLTEGVTYASDSPVGLKRMLEIICESAFFSQYLAGRCAIYLMGLLVVTGVLAVSFLLFCLHTLHDAGTSVTAARSVAATLVFLISVGTIRSWRGYAIFSTKADQAHAEAARLLARETLEPCEAHRLLSEYQIARATAPLIPTTVWKLHRSRLNQIWATRHSSN
jgi:hypothetical protein